MEAYRDQYATLFNNGRNVVVIGLSVDADTTLAAWARELETPVLFASDTNGHVGSLYGAYDAAHHTDVRALFVIAPDGRVAYHVLPFKVLAAQSYTDLAHVVDSLSPPATPPDTGAR